MRYTSHPTCIDEAVGGPDGAETGTLRAVQSRIEEFLASRHAEAAGAVSTAPGARAVRPGADLLDRADAICARYGLAPSPLPVPRAAMGMRREGDR